MMLGLLALSAQADTTWLANPADGIWSHPNWTGSVPSTTISSSAAAGVGTLIFDTSSITTTSSDIDHVVLGLNFTGGSNFTINASAGVLYMYDGGIQVQGGTQTINANIRLRGTGGAVSVVNNGTLSLAGGLWVARESPSGTTTVTFSGTGNTTVGAFARRSSADNMNIVKTGTGTLTIAGANTGTTDTAAGRSITGTLTITGGTVRISDETQLGSDSGTFNAAQITLNGGTLGAYGTLTIDDPSRGITLGTNGGTFNVESAFTLTVSKSRAQVAHSRRPAPVAKCLPPPTITPAPRM